MISIKDISFGFPQNITVSNTIEALDTIKKQDYSNKNVHLKLTIDKLMKKNFNTEQLSREIMESTGAARVKIDFIYDNNSSLRAKEISEQTNPIEKFKSYAELHSIKYNDSLLNKIQKIQDDMLLESFTPHDTFTLEYMSLRGAIGIMDGQHKDEVSYNFDGDFNEGIIGITGPSGSGKSTLIENMHPYPCMLSRIGTLKEHFCLKDSHRILIYRSSSGKKYRISMYIDGCAKNVMTRYFVETKEGDNNWEPIKSIDGSSDVYNEWVEATFGPKELFLRTSFYTNAAIKNMPDLAQATKGEKMALFSTLAGTDYLSTFSEQAKLAINQKEKDIKELKDQLSGFDELEQRQSENESIIENNTALIEEYKGYIENDTKELAEYEIKQQDFIKASASYDIYRTQLNEKNVELRDVEGKISICNNNIEAYEQQLSETDLYKEQLKWYDENMAKRKSLISEEQKVRDEFNNLQASMEKKQSEYNKNQMKLVSTKGTINTLEREIKHLNSSIPELDGNCPVCGAPLQQHKKEQLEKEIKDIKEQIEIAETQLTENNNLKEDLEKWLKEHSLESFKSELTTINNKLVSISNDITDIDTYAESLDIDGIKDILNNTGSHLEAERNNLKTLLSKKVDIENKRTELQSIMDNIPEDFSDKITILKRGIEDTKQSIATLTAENTMAQKELDRIKSLSEQIKSIKKEVDAANVDIKEYTIIQQAFSNNGIQAIELDSAAPEISNIANNILEECYGPRFTVSFDTQRDTKDGRRIDDFIINVFDSDNARLKRLDLISSGEGTLIKQTLYYAFSVIRARRTGFCFKTRFLDESDSALDSELRIKYLKMIESAHKQCGAHQTILITHSSELKEIIEQKIEL